jgi:asparagine synthase (glutamine-hydrolysing)
MCGIVGVINRGSRQAVEAMNSIQTHRGPDDAGTWYREEADGPFVGLGNRRLKIIDLSPAGHMPMSNEDGSVWITYNGETYNFPALRAELVAKGHRFQSDADTEVIVHLYEEEGLECVKRLHGMFAFALWDERKQRLLLARDRFGVKPLYYHLTSEGLAFASEIKAMLLLPDVSREIDIHALDQFASFLWVPDPKTMFSDVLKLPAGHYAVYQNDQLTLSEFWDYEYPDADEPFANSSENELIEEARTLFYDAVHRQMISDVPVGAFLSSGLDSSSIVAAMSHFTNEPINTYTITFPPKYRRGESALDDPGIARRFAAQQGCTHHEMVIDPDVVSLLPKIIWHLDEPIAASIALTTYLVCQAARESSTVLLSGVGGDELFAGYRKHIGHGLAQQYQRIPAWLRRGLIEPVARAMPSFRGTSIKDYVRLAKKMARSGSLPPRERFILDATYLTEAHKRSLYSEHLRHATQDADPWCEHLRRFDRVADADFLNQMLYLDLRIFMISLNLTLTDKMSMAQSIEVRVPFLDEALSDFLAMRVPPSMKLRGRTTKYLLRQAMGGVLPEEVLSAPKAGFGAPVDYWLANELRPMVDDLLSEQRIRSRGYFEPKAVQRLLKEHRDGRQDWSMQIWQLLTLELWLQSFVDEK